MRNQINPYDGKMIKSNQIKQFKYQTGGALPYKYFIRMSNKFTIESLKKIKAEATNNKQTSTLGFIVDSTSPYRKDVKKDYCMKIKIIDSTLTNEELYVFLFAKNIDDYPTNLAIGDIVFVRNYVFENQNGKFSCKKPFNSLESECRFFSGKPEETGYHPIDDNIGIDDENGAILNSIINLRKFSKGYFQKQKVPLFQKNGKNTSSDFDLILKVTDCQQSGNNSWRITMTDTKNIFSLLHSRLVKAGVYKVRSIANFSWNEKQCSLTGNDFTYFLEVSEWMKSYQPAQWDKLPFEKSVIATQNQVLSTKILKQKRGLARKLTTLKEMITKENHSEQVRVKCEFYQVFTSFDHALRKFDEANLVEKEYQHQNGKYIYNIHFAISDSSLEGQIYNVYLYTYDGRGNEFLPGLNTQGIYGQNILDYRQKYDHIVNRLLEETDSDSTLEIVLSPLFNGRQTVYRIVDTELIL